MKKEYKKPNIVSIELSTLDIITTSGGIIENETGIAIGDDIPGGDEWSLDF